MENTHDHDQLLREIKKKINSIRTYTPKVGVFGDSGIGKSSLCNALFGKEEATISDVAACTREPQEIFLKNAAGNGIILVDVPGVGENIARHEEYTDLYKSLLPNLDLVLWGVQSSSRSYQSSLDAYNKAVLDSTAAPPILVVITQTDRISPSKEWNHEAFVPGKTQEQNIKDKIIDVSGHFKIPADNIIAIAVEELTEEERKNEKPRKSWHLQELVNRIVDVLPNEKKYSFTREANEEVVSDAARVSAEKGIWDSVKEFAGNAWDAVKEAVKEEILPVVMEVAKQAVRDFLGGLFKKKPNGWF